MQILVDDEPYAMAGPTGQTVGELANEVCRNTGQGEARFVVALRCNGRFVGQEELPSVLQRPAEEFDRLEMQTQPIAALVHSTIEQAVGVLEDSAHTREKAADFLAAGQQETAMRELQRFLDTWKQIHETLIVTSTVLHVDLDSVSAGGVRLTDVLEALKTHLTELRGAMVQGDFVVVADILRYELSEPLIQLASCFEQLRDSG